MVQIWQKDVPVGGEESSGSDGRTACSCLCVQLPELPDLIHVVGESKLNFPQNSLVPKSLGNFGPD